MGFIANLFKGNSEHRPSTWKDLTDLDQLDKIWDETDEHAVAIFKHSTRCSISFHMMHRLESDWDLNPDDCSFYFLDLVQYRAISNEVASRSGVRHQSPQLIVIKDRKAIYDASHGSISVDSLKASLA